MINLKQIVVPKVDGVEVLNFDASSDFTTDPIEFPNSGKEFAVDVTMDETAELPADSFTINTAGADLTDGSYPGVEMTNGAIVDITVAVGIVTVVTLVSGGSGYIDGDDYSLVEDLPGTAPTQPVFTAVVTSTIDSTMTIKVCSTRGGIFKTWSTATNNIDLSDLAKQFTHGAYMPGRFAILEYTANTTTGLMSIHITK